MDLLLSFLSGKVEHCWLEPGTVQGYCSVLPGLLARPCCPNLGLLGSISSVLHFSVLAALLGSLAVQAWLLYPELKFVD